MQRLGGSVPPRSFARLAARPCAASSAGSRATSGSRRYGGRARRGAAAGGERGRVFGQRLGVHPAESWGGIVPRSPPKVRATPQTHLCKGQFQLTARTTRHIVMRGMSCLLDPCPGRARFECWSDPKQLLRNRTLFLTRQRNQSKNKSANSDGKFSRSPAGARKNKSSDFSSEPFEGLTFESRDPRTLTSLLLPSFPPSSFL